MSDPTELTMIKRSALKRWIVRRDNASEWEKIEHQRWVRAEVNILRLHEDLRRLHADKDGEKILTFAYEWK